MALLGLRTPCGSVSQMRSARTSRKSCVVACGSLKNAADLPTNVAVSRRTALLSGIVALSLASTSGGHANAADLAEQGVEEYARLEEAGKLTSAKALDNIRSKYNFKRNPDGRVYVRSSKGTYYAVRLDMEVPGCMLFRNTSNGEIFALQTQALQQIDLTNDQVVILVLGDGEWENAISPITVEDDSGSTKTLTMTENEFRNVVGLISMTDGGQEGNANS